MKALPLISITSLWLSKIGIVCAILAIIAPFVSEKIGLDWEFTMLILGLATIFLGGLGFVFGMIGNIKKHEQQQSAQKGFKYGIYAISIILLGFIGFIIYYFIRGGGPV